MLTVKYWLFLSDFNEPCIFWAEFRKILMSNVVKIRPARTDLFHADGQTDRQT
jgi:hypothetical protein